ncbi:MAG: hypothetical protein IJ429_01210 [Lachnospiraceae bacterium]|nr:hypothetical protein [Lachnospiraceae bacterium]
MSSNEAYLDSLLAALNGEQNKEKESETVELTETSIEETLEAETVEDTAVKMIEGSIEDTVVEIPEESIEDFSETVMEEMVEEASAPEEIVITPVADDPNKALGADEIAALFAQANVDIATGEVVEETDEDTAVEMVEESIEDFSEAVMEEMVEEAPASEEIEITPVSDDPNKALGADEIAALFAQANVDMETGEAVEEVEEAEEQPQEEIEITPVSDDPNKALGADEIAALFAQANVDMETGEAVEEVEEVEEAEEQPQEEIVITPVSDDPNKALGADEIAALFAQANVDMTTGDTIEEAESADDEIPGDMEMPEGLSLDDMLAQMSDEEDDINSEGANADEDAVSNTNDESHAWEQEEIEIDMNNPEELELLLGLAERPDRKPLKTEEMSEQEEEALMESMGDENPDLQEINDLLNKLDNNELINDGIEESVLVGFDDEDFDAEQEPWLEELLGGDTASKKEKTKKKKRKFPFFGKKKKEEQEPEVVRMDEESSEDLEQLFAEETTEQEQEEITDILQAFSEDNADIPFDLFADDSGEMGGDAAEQDLLALVEADEKKNAKTKKKAGASEEKKGFFAKMMDILTEEVPDDEEEEADKEKKEKKEKKAKKSKKKPVTDAADNEGILEELDAEEDDKKKKRKKKKEEKEKKKKQKKVKEENLEDIIEDSKKLPMKMVYRIFALCASIMALVLLVNHFVPKLWSMSDARNAFYKQDYETTYREMSGKELSESDQRLYTKAKMILQLDHKVAAYERYKEMDMPVEALDALLSGYLLWQQLAEKIAEYDAVTETDEIKGQILNALSSDYQISEEEAAEINALGNYDYTLKLEEITGSLSRQNGTWQSEEETDKVPAEEVPQQEVQPQQPKEDVLPEEEVQ